MLGDPLAHPKLHEVVAERLTHIIVDGQLHPGDHLPTERELMQQLGVSRGTVREATKVLAAHGLVTIRPGAGVVVAAPDNATITESLHLFLRREQASLAQLLELRLCLEVEAAGLAAQRATEADDSHLRACLGQMQAALDQPEIFIDLDIQFHRIIAEATRNSLFVAILDALGDVLLQSRKMSVHVPDGIQRAYEAHQRIGDMLLHRDSMGARMQMHAHLDQTRRDVDLILAQEDNA